MPTEPRPLTVRDVTLRDGLQDEAPIATEAKLAIFEALVAAGVTDLEVTSFVRADRVPALADAEQLVTATNSVVGVRRWGLVLNERGAERALAAGLGHLQFVLSVSEPHNLANAGRTVDDSFAALAAIRDAAPGAAIEVTLATVFGCPYAGPVDPAVVDVAVARSLEIGVDGIGLADTIGTGVPSEVGRVVASTVERSDGSVPVGAHLHDTRGLAIANALAAVDAGAVRLDAALGGLGGCPFAPGASGNVAIEDLAHVLVEEGHDVGVDVAALVAASALACAATGRRVGSHVGAAGPRFAVLHTAASGS